MVEVEEVRHDVVVVKVERYADVDELGTKWGNDEETTVEVTVYKHEPMKESTVVQTFTFKLDKQPKQTTAPHFLWSGTTSEGHIDSDDLPAAYKIGVTSVGEPD